MKDPDDARKEREEEEKRLKDYREHNMSCAHDRSTVSAAPDTERNLCIVPR